MKLIGNLKKRVEETESKAEAKEVIKQAGMLLTDEELDNVAGGLDELPPSPVPSGPGECPTSPTGEHSYIGGRRSSYCIYCRKPKPDTGGPLTPI